MQSYKKMYSCSVALYMISQLGWVSQLSKFWGPHFRYDFGDPFVNLGTPSITMFTVGTWRFSGYEFLDVNVTHNATRSQWLARNSITKAVGSTSPWPVIIVWRSFGKGRQRFARNIRQIGINLRKDIFFHSSDINLEPTLA